MKLRQAYQSMQESYMQHGHADSDMNGSLNIQVSPKTRANRESPAKSAIIATESFRMRLLQTSVHTRLAWWAARRMKLRQAYQSM